MSTPPLFNIMITPGSPRVRVQTDQLEAGTAAYLEVTNLSFLTGLSVWLDDDATTWFSGATTIWAELGRSASAMKAGTEKPMISFALIPSLKTRAPKTTSTSSFSLQPRLVS